MNGVDHQKRYGFEELAVGQRFFSGYRTMVLEEIVAFAEAFDPQPSHIDEEAAKSGVFGGVVASGWHTASITMRLLIDGGLPFFGQMIGAGAEIAWPRPTRPGDRLHVESEVLALTPSRSNLGRGTALVRSTTWNQDGEAVQVLTARIKVQRRRPLDRAPAGPA